MRSLLIAAALLGAPVVAHDDTGCFQQTCHNFILIRDVVRVITEAVGNEIATSAMNTLVATEHAVDLTDPIVQQAAFDTLGIVKYRKINLTPAQEELFLEVLLWTLSYCGSCGC